MNLKGYIIKDNEDVNNFIELIQEQENIDINEVFEVMEIFKKNNLELFKKRVIEIFRLLQGEVISIQEDSSCPICGGPTYNYSQDEYYFEDLCLHCDYNENQFLDWEDIRCGNNRVLIWNAYFNGTNVEDIVTLNSIKDRLNEGYVIDSMVPKRGRDIWFRNDYMSKNVIRNGMREQDKFINTMILVMKNAKNKEAKLLAEYILNTIVEQEVNGDNKTLARMSL